MIEYLTDDGSETTIRDATRWRVYCNTCGALCLQPRRSLLTGYKEQCTSCRLDRSLRATRRYAILAGACFATVIVLHLLSI